MDGGCEWPTDDPLYMRYHDTEWGVPEYDSRALFEKLILDGFQAGLSWITILRKRDNFRAAFDGFDPDKIAEWDEVKILELLDNPGIIRHRGKIEATIGNARAWQKIEMEQGFEIFLWSYVDGKPLQNNPRVMADVPAQTDMSVRLSQDLKKAEFKFCGPTIVYAFMQAVGMVNDHMVGCPRNAKVQALAL
ncbi:MAG: DNA-3-methyladenine glycosylase I [Paracoccaceae bacterium]